MLQVDKVYVTHWNKLVDRKKLLSDQFISQGIDNVSWVENFDKDNWDINEVKSQFPFIFEKNVQGRYLRHSEISLALKHCWIMMDGIENNYDSILIFEDDVILAKSFVESFNKFKNQLPENWDICFVGSCSNLHCRTVEGLNVYRVNQSRCCHAYMLSKSGLEKMKPHLNIINEAIDWYFNYKFREMNLNVFWFEPSLAEQSTKFESTVQF